MASYVPPMCLWCTHFRNAIGPGGTGPLGCAAYPESPGIPEPILHSKHDHRQPYAGDHAIQFEPKDPHDGEGAAWLEFLFAHDARAEQEALVQIKRYAANKG